MSNTTDNTTAFKKYPIGLVGISIIGIAVIVIMALSSWGHVKLPTYFGFFMNVLFYINILIFALYGYHNEKSLTKKPVKNLLKSFCIILVMITVFFRPFLPFVAVIFGIVIVLDIVMMKNIKDLKLCTILIFVIMALLLVAAIIKLGAFGHMPLGFLAKGAWCFNVFNQVIQWTAFGMVYILRFSEFKKAGYLE